MEKISLTSSATPSFNRSEIPVKTMVQADEASQIGAAQNSTDSKESRVKSATSAVEKFKTLVHDLQRNLDFSVDDSSGQVVVKVMDGESGKLIRQIPSEDLLRLSERLEDMRSLLFKAEA
jgi:flagellar protein FlaG